MGPEMDVLVVDDELETRLTLAEVLRDEGYSVGELADGRNLVATVAAARPALVLLDLTIPGFDVETTIAELRTRGLRAETSIVALTGVWEADRVAAELGLDGLVRKPPDLNVLLGEIARYVRHSEPPRANAPL